MLNDFQYDPKGIAFTERKESLKLVGYIPGPGDVPTVGYGHTGPYVFVGQVITQQQAEEWLSHDIAWAVAAVKQWVRVPLMQNQFDALVDFTFNVGAHAFETSHLLLLLNSGNFAAADQEFLKWVFVKGVKNRGLYNRRTAEQGEFEGK